MASPNHVFMLSIILMLFLSHSVAANTPSKLLKELCSETTEIPNIEYDDCVDALQSNPKAANADLTTLAKIAIHLGISKAKGTQKYVKQVLKIARPSLQKPLEACLFQYEAVESKFSAALGDLSVDALTASYDAMTVLDGTRMCEDELGSKKSQIPALVTTNQKIRLYSQIAAVATNRIEREHHG